MNFLDLNTDTDWYTWTRLAWAKNILYISDTGQRHNLPDRDIDACTDWHRRTYTENYRICIMATPFSSAAVLFCTHRSCDMNATFRQNGYVRNYYDWRQSNYKNSRNKNINSYSTSESRWFLKSSAWIVYIGLYVTWLMINEVLETCITLTLIKNKYVYKITLMKKLRAGCISKMLSII
jgi:hypothetical protein